MIAPARRRSDADDPDARLMVRVRDDDVEAFGELFHRHQRRLVRLVTHMMGSSRVSDDLAQQVFLQVFRGRKSYTPTAQFSTWLFTITRNVVFNARRGIARRRETPIYRECDIRYAKMSTERDPLELAERAETQRAVRDAIGQLGSLQQRAIQLVYLRGYSYRAAAEKMDVTEDSIRQLVHRGKGKLRILLESCPVVEAPGNLLAQRSTSDRNNYR